MPAAATRSRRSRFGLSSDPSPPRPRMPRSASLPPPTHRRSPLTLAVLRLVRSGCPFYSARIDAARFDRDAPSFTARRCIDPCRARPRVMRRPLFSGGVPLPRWQVTWLGRVPFRRRSVLGFPSREHWCATGDLAWLARERVTRVTVLLSTLFPDGTRGVSDVAALRRFAPARRVRRVSSTDADPRAVCRFTGRSGFAARSAGPKLCNGRLLSFPDFVAAQARRLGSGE